MNKQEKQRMKTMANGLKPCPCCGSEGVGTVSCHPILHCGGGIFKEDKNVTNWRVICGNCGTSTDVESSKSDAKRKWNRRATND